MGMVLGWAWALRENFSLSRSAVFLGRLQAALCGVILQILQFAAEVHCRNCNGARFSAVSAFWLRLKMPKA